MDSGPHTESHLYDLESGLDTTVLLSGVWWAVEGEEHVEHPRSRLGRALPGRAFPKASPC